MEDGSKKKWVREERDEGGELKQEKGNEQMKNKTNANNPHEGTFGMFKREYGNSAWWMSFNWYIDCNNYKLSFIEYKWFINQLLLFRLLATSADEDKIIKS